MRFQALAGALLIASAIEGHATERVLGCHLYFQGSSGVTTFLNSSVSVDFETATVEISSAGEGQADWIYSIYDWDLLWMSDEHQLAVVVGVDPEADPSVLDYPVALVEIDFSRADMNLKFFGGLQALDDSGMRRQCRRLD